MRAIKPLLTVALFLLLVGVTLAQPKPQEAILGKWVLSQKEGGAEIKFSLDFAKDNKLKGEVAFTVGGDTKTEGYEGTYKILEDNKTLEVITTNKSTKKEETNKITIRSLNEREMVLVDVKDGKEMRFERGK